MIIDTGIYHRHHNNSTEDIWEDNNDYNIRKANVT